MAHLEVACTHLDPGGPGALEWSDKFEAARAFQGRLKNRQLPRSNTKIGTPVLTVQRGIHPSHVDQQAHHCHRDSAFRIRQQLLLEDFATFAALRHRIDVNLGERMAFRLVAVLGKAPSLVVEHQTQKIILDIFAPEWYAVLLFQVLHLVP